VDLLHKYTGGVPRLINLVCDRSLLGGYSARTNRITLEMVERAATTLDLVPPRPSIIEWVRAHAVRVAAGTAAAAAIVVAAALSVALMQARSVRGDDAARTPPASIEAASRASVDPAVPPARDAQPTEGTAGTGGPASMNDSAKPAASYLVLVGSFRQQEEATRLTGQLQEQGYRSTIERATGTRGVWYQVLVGPYSEPDQARQDHERVRQLPGYSDARLVVH
jgi:general secretion pathway protein A